MLNHNTVQPPSLPVSISIILYFRLTSIGLFGERITKNRSKIKLNKSKEAFMLGRAGRSLNAASRELQSVVVALAMEDQFFRFFSFLQLSLGLMIR